MTQQEHINKIHMIKSELDETYTNYWNEFSDLSTWQFWVVLAMLIVPLVILFFKIDRSKIFLLGFYGFSIHMLASYLDSFGMRKVLWDYPYAISTHLPGSIGIDAAVIPVYFMLLYQWCLNKNKNYWLYGTLSALGFTFILKPLMVKFNFFQLYTSWFVLLFAYLLAIYGAKIITNIFTKMADPAGKVFSQEKADNERRG